MKIAIFGATGIVGKAIMKEALAQGHEVTVLTRDANKVNQTSNKVTVVEGEVTDRAKHLSSAIEQSHAGERIGKVMFIAP